ncbi:hypothetical protein ACRCPS_17470 [Pseudomonas aeruginosa]
MSRIPFDARDLDQKVVSKVFADLFRPIKSLSDADSNTFNTLGARAALYRDFHELQVESRKNQLPAAGSLSRDDIRAAFAIGMRRVVDIGVMEAYRIAGNARLRLLSIDRRTREWLAEQELAALKASAERDGVPQEAIDEMVPVANTPTRQHHKEALIAAGAPGHYLTVRTDGRAFQWSQAYALYSALYRDPLKLLDGDPAIAGAGDAEDALAAFAQMCLVPESWVDLEAMIRDGLEVPDYEVLTLFDVDGNYVGRVLRQRWHFGVIPDLFYTDEELIKGKVALLTGHILASPGWAKHAQQSVLCSEPVYHVRRDLAGGMKPPDIPDMWTTYQVPTEGLVELKGVFCGHVEAATAQRHRTKTWAINGDLSSMRAVDWSSPNQRFISGIRWLEESDFPLLYPAHLGELPKVSKSGRPAFAGLRESRGLLPDSALDLAERAKRLMQIEAFEAIETLTDQGSLKSLIKRIHRDVSKEALEQAAERLFEQLHVPGLGYEGFNLDEYEDIEVERHRLGARRRQTLGMLPLFATRLSSLFPELAQLGHFTIWFILGFNDGLLDEYEEHFDADGEFDDYGPDDVLIPLIMLASAAVTGVRPEFMQRDSALVAIHRWLENGNALDQIYPMAEKLVRYARDLNYQERLMKRVGNDIERQVALRERARAMGVAYVSDKVSSFGGTNPVILRYLEEGRMLMRAGSEIGGDRKGV